MTQSNSLEFSNGSNKIQPIGKTAIPIDTSPGARSEFFFGGGWQTVSLGGGVTVMEKREILVGWVTKVCLKCTKKLG